jgi:hypothetical protein
MSSSNARSCDRGLERRYGGGGALARGKLRQPEVEVVVTLGLVLGRKLRAPRKRSQGIRRPKSRCSCAEDAEHNRGAVAGPALRGVGRKLKRGNCLQMSLADVARDAAVLQRAGAARTACRQSCPRRRARAVTQPGGRRAELAQHNGKLVVGAPRKTRNAAAAARKTPMIDGERYGNHLRMRRLTRSGSWRVAALARVYLLLGRDDDAGLFVLEQRGAAAEAAASPAVASPGAHTAPAR